MIDPSARIHATADLEADVSIGPGPASGTAPRSGRGARIGRDGGHRSGRVHRRGRHARRPGQGPERRAHLPRRDDRGRRVHRPGRDPDQRPSAARRQRRRRARPGGRLDGQPDPHRRSAPRSGPARSSSPAATSARTRWSGPAPSSPTTCQRTRWSSATRPAGSAGSASAGSGSPTRPADGATASIRRCRAVCRPADAATTVDDADGSLARARPPGRAIGAPRMIPIARPDIGPEEIAAVTEVLAERDARRRPARRRARGALGRVHRRQARDRGQQRHRRADVHLRGPRPRAGRRGHHGRPHVQRDRQLDPVHRRDAGLRRHRAATPTSSTPAGSRPRSRRGRGRSARSTCSACRPTWTAITAIADRHGLAVVEDACQAHGADVRRPAGRQLRARRVQPVRHEEHDDRRGRPHHDRRRPAGRLDPALPQPGHARALPPRDPRLQLPADRHRRGDRPVPARQARAQHGPPAGDRGALRRGLRRPADPDARSPRPAGPTSSTSTRSTSATIATAIVADLAAAGRRDRHLLPDPGPPPAVRRSSAGSHADLPVTDRGVRAHAVAADVPGAAGRGPGRRSSRRSATAVERRADGPTDAPSPRRGSRADDRRLVAGRRPRASASG